MNTEIPTTTYWLDKEYRVTRVSPEWDDFAKLNNGENITSEKVVGKLIFDYITDDTTRMWLETILLLAKVTQKTFERPYRCDSPDLKRFMKLRVTTDEHNEIRLEHIVLSTEKRYRNITFEYKKDFMSIPYIRCSICGFIKSDNKWSEPDELIKKEATIKTHEFKVIYSVCESCKYLIPHKYSQAIIDKFK